MAKAKKHDENLKNEQELTEENIKEASNSNGGAKEAPEAAEKTEAKEAEENTESKESEEADKAQAEIEGLKDRFLRLQADFLNYKSRTQKEKTSTYSSAVSDMILDLLPVVDNLERAIAADKTETDNFKEGVVMVYNQLMGILNKKGLKEVDALHKPFDHNVHYGVAFEASDEYEDGTVIDVLQKGYTVNDKCIRPAMVRICRK